MHCFIAVVLSALAALSAGCAGDGCADGACLPDTDVYFGMSRLLAIEPESGEMRWGVDFQGEHLRVLGLADNDHQVVLDVSDACWAEDRAFAFDVATGAEVSMHSDVQTPAGASCDEFTTTELPSLVWSDGICAGESFTAPGTLVGIDTADGTEIWRNEFAMDAFVGAGDVLLVLTSMADGAQHRISRIAPATGTVLWMHQQDDPVRMIGADDLFVFGVDSAPFALSRNTGDVVWRAAQEGWSFLGPELADGVLLDDTLYVWRIEFPASPCSDTQ